MTARFADPAAQHHYRLTGKKGDRLAIRVLAQRIGSPLDPAVAVLDAKGQEKAQADDSSGSTDPELVFELPEDGDYTLVVTDATTKGGQADAIYHLAVARINRDSLYGPPSSSMWRSAARCRSMSMPIDEGNSMPRSA